MSGAGGGATPGGSAMGRSRPLRPALIFAAVGAGICLGAGAVFPVWLVPNVPPAGSGCPFADPDSYSACPGTLWQAVLAAPALIRCPVWRTDNALVGGSLLALGALAGADFYWFVILPLASRLRARNAGGLKSPAKRELTSKGRA